MLRTIQLDLVTPKGISDALGDTTIQFTDCYDEVCRIGWEFNEKNSTNLHHLTYYDLRKKHPELHCDLVIQARKKAKESLTSALTLDRQRKIVSCPHSEFMPPRFID